MVQVTLKPNLARLLISPRERSRDCNNKSNYYLEEEIKVGGWDKILPIWVTPNFLLNGVFCGIGIGEWHPTFKPLIIYNGHHRLEKALKHNLPIKIYIRYTPGNPEIPAEERLYSDDFDP